MAPTSPKSLRVAWALASLGFTAAQTIDIKLQALANAGYTYAAVAIDEFYIWVKSHEPDLPASTMPKEYESRNVPGPDDDAIWEAFGRYATKLLDIAAGYGVKLLILQPLGRYEGWMDPVRNHFARRNARRWVTFASQLGVEFLQVGSNDQPNLNDNINQMAEDLRYLGEMGLAEPKPVKISYEPWCTGESFTTDWEGCYEVLKEANHPNLGLCMDSAQIAMAPRYGFDPLEGLGYDEAKFQAALERIRALPADQIHYVEITSCKLPQPGLTQGSDFDGFHKPGGNPRFSWTFCGRHLPYVGRHAGQHVETSGAQDADPARCAEILDAVLETGFNGPISLEPMEIMYLLKPDPTIPEKYCQASVGAWQRLCEDIELLREKRC